MTNARAGRVAEVGFWLTGFACACTVGLTRWHVAQTEKAAASIVPRAVSSAVAPPEQAGLLGRIEIPALSITAPLVEEADSSSLARGIGHIQGTAEPGAPGNFAVAAHRDTFFRPLRNVEPGMQIVVVTRTDRYMYVVDGTKIVSPENVGVLNGGKYPQMTLITCFPFHYIGPAPKRFVVTAHLTSLPRS